ncbi:MAG TPA: hypothetical protein VK025_09890 [Steroidobacter sp.]|nr:hypothetical protein [Steroidobacter sp.]
MTDLGAPNRLRRSDPRAAGTPRLEWALGAFGALLLACAASFLVHEALTADDRPGAVTASVMGIHEVDGGYLVTFVLRNLGDATLSELHVSARLMDGDEEVERAQTVIDYLPGGSTREGGFYLRSDPRDGALDIRPEGYVIP